jgi:hypothetical protein
MSGGSTTATLYISYSTGVYQSPALGYTGEVGGKLGVQQQQGILQETSGELRWEKIVPGLRQGGGEPVTPPTRRRTHQEQHQRDAQQVGRYQNKMTPSMLVRRNLASYIHGALLYRAELIPTDAQIRAATLQDMRTFSFITTEGEGFCATAEKVYAIRIKEEEMVQGCENVNSLSIFHPTKPKMRKFTILLTGIKKVGPA